MGTKNLLFNDTDAAANAIYRIAGLTINDLKTILSNTLILNQAGVLKYTGSIPTLHYLLRDSDGAGNLGYVDPASILNGLFDPNAVLFVDGAGAIATDSARFEYRAAPSSGQNSLLINATGRLCDEAVKIAHQGDGSTHGVAIYGAASAPGAGPICLYAESAEGICAKLVGTGTAISLLLEAEAGTCIQARGTSASPGPLVALDRATAQATTAKALVVRDDSAVNQLASIDFAGRFVGRNLVTVLDSQFTDIQSSGTTATNFYSAVIAANRLGNDGERARFSVRYAAAAMIVNTGRLKIFLNATSIFDSGDVIFPAGMGITLSGEIIRVNATTLRVCFDTEPVLLLLGLTPPVPADVAVAPTGAITFKSTGQITNNGDGAANGQLTAKAQLIEWVGLP